MADPSKINSLVLFKGKKVSTEKIDERILELLGLQDEYELSYEEYIGYLREAMVASRMSKSRYSTAETESITNEWKRVKSKKGRFRPKKISAESFKKGSAAGINLNKQKALTGTKPLALPPATDKMVGGNEIATIIDALGEIIKSLTQQNKDAKKASELDRKSAEQKTRGERESRLEKGVGLIAKAAEKILAPFKSILSRIIDFITAVFFGRLMIKLLRWFSDPENQKKFQSILRFLGDHWPTLLALYLRFGTGIGKLVGTLSSILIKGGLRLAAAAAGLLAKAGVGKAGKFAKFLGGRKGKLLGAGLEVAATVGTTMALSSGIESIGKDKPKVEGRAGGGSIKIPKFAGGGLNFGGFGNMFSGLVSGQKGVDKIPAMLSDGEFVMSRGAVQKYGVDTLEGMNAAGGGTNKPKMISGISYAAGGGFIGNPIAANEAWINYMNLNPEKFSGRGGIYGKQESFNSASRDFIKTFTKTGKPPQWAKFVEDIENVRKSTPSGQKQPSSYRQSSSSLAKSSRGALSTELKSFKPRGGGLSKIPNLPGIKTNMRVPGGFGNIKSLGAELLLNYLVDKGFDYMDAKRVADQVEKGKKTSPEKRDAGIEKLRNLVDKEERWQRGGGGLYDKIIGLGKETQSERLSKHSRAILSGLGANTYQGGKMVGGHGLKQQSFKDMPKTQIMSDDKGRPFVGYKAMRGGKPVYVRGPRPGEGTSNPFEMLGRAINPNAYKQSDAASAQKKYQEASAGSIQSLKDRGASQLTIAKRQAQLKKPAPAPPTPPKTRFVNPSQGGAKTKSQLVGGGGKPSAPKFSASHPSGHSKTAKVLGIK